MPFPTLTKYHFEEKPDEKTWEYIFANKEWYPKGIKTHLLLMFPQMFAAGAGVAAAFPPGYKQIIATYENQYLRASYDPRDFLVMSRLMTEKTFNDPDWIIEYEKDFQIATKKFRAMAEDVYLNFSEKNHFAIGDKLISLIDTAVIPQSYGYLTETFTILSGSYWVTDTIREMLPDVTDEEIVVLLRPENPSFIQAYQEDLIAADSDEKLRVLLEKFYFIKGSYFILPELSSEDARIERESLLLEEKTERTAIVKKESIIQKAKSPEKLYGFIRMIEKSIAIQDERKENVLRLNYALLKLVRLAENYLQDFSIKELLSATPHELLSLLRGGSHPDLKKIILQRNRRSIWIFDNKNYTITTDHFYVDPLFTLFSEDAKEVKGFVASRGHARGEVKVVPSEADFSKIKEGDILVTSMTRPEFMPILKKARAFITDEGGITCHAAIVSRELKKPCIIGTKIATQILHDGDLIEVDADNGMVKVLERVK